MSSIRGRLLFWQSSALLLTGLLVSVITYLLAWDGFNRIRDYDLEQIAYSVVRHGVQYDDDSDIPDDRGQFISQIWAVDGSLFYSSLDDIGPPPQTAGFHVINWKDMEWRVFTLKEGGLTIQVATTIASRVHRFMTIAPWLLIPLVVLVVVLGLLIRVAVSRALAPLEQVRSEISRRGAQCLCTLDNQDLPEEVAPLVTTLNDLLVHLDYALAVQRRFVADAAHELRTPLTAVKLQAQIARRTESDAERQVALVQLAAGVDRATHLINQLLGMARLDPATPHTQFAPLLLHELLKQVVADFSSQAEAHDIDLGIAACAVVSMTGYSEGLRMMLNNLVDNALRYTSTGGRVDVALQDQDGKIIISVSDTGPGIPVTERDRVFERFQRLAPADIPGSGLGLAIVKQVVALHKGVITLDDAPGGGLLVTIELCSQ